ncbi:PEGA domain-containing protein [Sorangium sp. So ce513]|uniref:PEGA domain-containing protein n=1 Tax=Sorangium sp. So ce513 TaxID=3133315 RepID=UPI003F64283A
MRNLTMRCTAVACCALSACLFAPAAARAQGSPPPAAVDDDVPGANARAAQLYREGNLAFDQKRWAEAELLYLKAWALVRSFDIATNLGHVQLRLNKPRSAATFLAFALRTAPPSTKPEQIARMREFLGEAKAQVGTLRVRAMNVPDAEVYVDGERVAEEAARHEMYLEPGEHVLLLRHAGYEDAVIRVVAAPGLTETIAHRLKPKAEKAPEAAGPGAAGAPVAAGAPATAGPRAASEAGRTKLPETTATTPATRSWVPAIALGATSIVALGVGIGMTAASSSARQEANEQREGIRSADGRCIEPPSGSVNRCKAFQRNADDAEIFGTAALVSYVAAGALATAATAYVLWPRRSRTASTGVQVFPTVRADGGALLLVGAW